MLQVGNAGEHFHNRTHNPFDVYKTDPEKLDIHIASDYEKELSDWSFYETQNTGEFSVDRKRIGKL